MEYKQWLNVWLENYIKPNVKQRTSEAYAQMIEKRIAPKIGDYDVNELSPVLLQTFVSELLRSGNARTGKGLSASTVNLAVTVLQSSLKTAFTIGEAFAYAADKIKRPKLKQKEVSCFSIAEQKKIERAVTTDDRKKLFGVTLCLYTGLRLGELLALTWEDVDLQKELIIVRKTCRDGKAEHGCLQIVGEPKTQSSKRIIPLPKQLLSALKAIKRAQKGNYVVSAGEGKPVGVRSYQRTFALLLKSLAIPHKGFHALRHTFATRALECGMDVKTLSELLGHKNATVTLNRYAHSLLEHKTNMMNRLGKLFLQ